MHKRWRDIKPFLEQTFGAERIAIIKDRLRLISTLFGKGRMLPYRYYLPSLAEFLGKKGEAAEIGVWRGKYSEIILKNNCFTVLYSIDPWKKFSSEEYVDLKNVSRDRLDEAYAMAKTQLSRYGAMSKIVRSTSREASRTFPDHALDFVYIDANHSYAGCRDDITAWWPKVTEGGIIAGDDYVNRRTAQDDFGVKRAVDEFAEKHGQKLYATYEQHPSWYIIKNGGVKKSALFSFLWKEIPRIVRRLRA